MKQLLLLVVVLVSGLFTTNAFAITGQKACMKYQRANSSWSKIYSVRGNTVNGYKLNSSARNKGYFAKYDDNTTYFVVSFKNGGYVSLPLKNEYLPTYYINTKDQAGKLWQIKAGWENCN